MKKVFMKHFIFLLVTLVVPYIGFCGPKEMFVGDVTLRIGMTKDEARAVLSKSANEVKPMGDAGGYSIVSGNGPPYDFIGSFGFDKNEKIDWISRSWGSFGGSQPVSLGKTLYNCLNKFDGKSFILTTGQGSNPGLAITSIKLSSSDGTEISIIISDSDKKGEGVGIQEILSAR